MLNIKSLLGIRCIKNLNFANQNKPFKSKLKCTLLQRYDISGPRQRSVQLYKLL